MIKLVIITQCKMFRGFSLLTEQNLNSFLWNTFQDLILFYFFSLMSYHFSSYRHRINISTISLVISSRNLKSNKRLRISWQIPSIKDLLKFTKTASFVVLSVFRMNLVENQTGWESFYRPGFGPNRSQHSLLPTPYQRAANPLTASVPTSSTHCPHHCKKVTEGRREWNENKSES